MENPFLISGYRSPEYFCDRESETQTLIDALRNGRNVTLISPRRMGKTGLITNVFYHLQQNNDVVVFYLDLYSTQNLSDFVTLLADTVLGKLDNNIQKAVQRVTHFIKSCRPTFSFDELTGLPKVGIELAENLSKTSLEEIFQYLQSSERTCYLAFDEFQQVNNYPEKGVEALLRSYIQFTTNVHFIFSGSRSHLMQEMFISPKRPFYQSTQLMNIGPVFEDKYYQFAGKWMQQQRITLLPELFKNIYNKFEGHTWYIQMIFNRLYNNADTIDHSKIDMVIAQVVAENEYAYQSLLATLPSISTQLLKAVAKEGKIKEITSGNFIKRYKFKAASSITRAIKHLTNYELVYYDGTNYSVYDRFMGIWLKNLPF